MRKILFLVAALILVGCGATPDIFEIFQSTNNCLGPYYIKNNIGHLDPVKLRQDEAMLKALFTTPWTFHPQNANGIIDFTRVLWHDKLLSSEREFCDSFAGVHITFVWTEEFPCDGSECWGLNDPKGITLEYSANSFAHELLHTYEWENGIFNTSTHPNWDTKGYHYLNDSMWWNERSPYVMTGPNGEQKP